MEPVIKISELISLKDNENLLIFDASGGPSALDEYQKSHLDGAQFIDLESDLADVKNPVNGGRHPLPTPEQFSNTLSEFGIGPESHVVVYDHMSGGNAAARFWWMLMAIGHKKVQVLDGGFQSAVMAGYPVNDKPVKPKKAVVYPATEWMLPTVPMSEIETVIQNGNLVIDVRDAARYRGETEPIDLIAGHIPGALNAPFKENLDADGIFLSPEQLKEKYKSLIGERKSDEVTFHCGSGVTACHSILAMAYAGLDVPNLYVGSWSEWSRNDNPMITKSN